MTYYILITLSVFLIMEGVTWLTHKYVMHGWLWVLHKDHHHRDHGGFFERNDWFFMIFAIPSMIMFMIGTLKPGATILIAIAAGITMYGLAYFLVHEVIIHRRFTFLDGVDNWYIRAIRRAHKMHHKHLGKEDGECFGMLWVPMSYFRMYLGKQKS